jgi:hypothetical protein
MFVGHPFIAFAQFSQEENAEENAGMSAGPCDWA